MRPFRFRVLIAIAAIALLGLTPTIAAEAQQSGGLGDVDCDGRLTIIDALVVVRYEVNGETDLEPCWRQAIRDGQGDLNLDGDTNVVDALLIARCDAGISGACPPEEPAPRRWTVTIGTANSAPIDDDTPQVDEGAHGVRVYCPISHFSYDDPIVHPGQPDATHLHVFWGNTTTDAYSTEASLLDAPRSSCEGGLNNRSAYWMPAVFNAAGEALIPEAAITYYKSFGHDDSFDRTTIQPIPNGLEMIANEQVLNGGPWNLQVGAAVVRGVDVTRFNISFPQCLAVHADGAPVLSSPAPHTDHLAYAAGGDQPNDCPESHPFRIPQVLYNVRYAVDFDSGWSLSSEMLHADYIAAWDAQSMQRITQCNIDRLFNCQFRDADGLLRDQLPERFVGPDGQPVYEASDQLLAGADRTPFGDQLTAMPH